MIFHEIKTKIRVLMSDFYYMIYSKIRNPLRGELPKYVMQYLDTACENKDFCTFSRKLEVMSNKLN